MSNETEAGTQALYSSSDTIDLRLKQETEIDPQGIDSSTDDSTLRLVDERIKQETDPVLRRVEELCALLAVWTGLDLWKQ